MIFLYFQRSLPNIALFAETSEKIISTNESSIVKYTTEDHLKYANNHRQIIADRYIFLNAIQSNIYMVNGWSLISLPPKFHLILLYYYKRIFSHMTRNN